MSRWLACPALFSGGVSKVRLRDGAHVLAHSPLELGALLTHWHTTGYRNHGTQMQVGYLGFTIGGVRGLFLPFWILELLYRY